MMIREARPEDAAAVHALYAPIVSETTISFELEPPTVDEMRTRIEKANEKHAFLISEDAEGLLGYAYGSTYRVRAAYQWSAEVSINVAPRARRRGVARALYDALFDALAKRGYYRAYAGIALPNEASLALHEAAGFTHIGTFHKVGYKFGGWRDVSWWERALREDEGTPRSIE